MSLVRVATGLSIKPKIAVQNVPSQYPAAWFREHPNKKPSLNILLNTSSLANSRKVIKRAIANNEVDINSALTFLYLFAETLKATSEEEWKSYNRIICTAGDEMTPLNFFDVSATHALAEKQGDTSATEKDDPWMAGHLLSTYRMLRTNNPNYQGALFDRIKSHLQGLTDANAEYVDPGDKYRGWLANKTFNKLVAAFDMFFHRFPEHEFASLRICTTGTRHRDCAGLTSYGYLAEVLGMQKTTDLMDWVFLDTIANDIDRIMTDDDEMEISYSYFPYQVDMGLVSKSSFSATINACFFEWAHLIGTMMGSARSQNARHITDKQSSDIFANAACVAYVYNSNFEFTKAYTQDGAELRYEEDADDDDVSNSPEEEILKSKDPTDWLTMIRSRGGSLPDKVKFFIKFSGQAVKDPRPGSMSEHLQKKAAIINLAVKPLDQLLVTLQYYASGSFMRCVDDMAGLRVYSMM